MQRQDFMKSYKMLTFFNYNVEVRLTPSVKNTMYGYRSVTDVS